VNITTIRLTEKITENGKLELALPDGLPPGEVQVTLEIEPEATTHSDLMIGNDIVAAGLTGGWADKEISNGQNWLEKQRRSRAERRGW
jgi:hypothetical protein